MVVCVTKPTKVMKEKAISAICYEIKMFRWIAKRITENVPASQENNAIIESFAIHTRALIDFFYEKPKQDDVVARHYVVDWKPPSKTSILVEAKTKANKQLAHITYSRVDDARYADPDKKSWDVEKISFDLEKTITLFFKSLPDDYHNLFSKHLGV